MVRGLAAYCGAVVVLVLLHCDSANSRSSVSTESVGPRSASTFAERETGQYYVIQKQGTEFRTQATSREKDDPDEYSATDRNKMKEDLEHMKDADTGDIIRQRRAAHRQKRFLDVNSDRRWPKAKVPYSFDASLSDVYRKEALAAMGRWQRYTCFRFLPWVANQTRTQYGLPDESHVLISLGDRCAAVQGNAHDPNGQWNSCCSRSTCMHELGHSLGLYHEHQSYLSRDFVRQNYEQIPDGLTYDYVPLEKSRGLTYQYDISDVMHYSSQTRMHVLFEDLRPMMALSNLFYAFKDVSLAHDCHGQYCGDFTQDCLNDGFVTLMDDVCTCLCPPGLDPATGCATTVTALPTGSEWPAGSYAMFASKTGCPGGSVFATGSWEHFGKGHNQMSREVSLGGNYSEESFMYEFCVKSSSSDSPNAPTWPKGRYCVLSYGGACPSGFAQGYIKYDDNGNLPGVGNGTLPDGRFATNTKLLFCCRDDGFTETPMAVPNTDNFVLFSSHGDQDCQEVTGMKWTQEWLKFDSLDVDKGYGGQYPYGPTGLDDLKLYYCHYTPANFNCGGSITLSQGTQSSVVIKSPLYPSAYGKNLECNWMIKTENPNDNILLNFQDFRLTSSGDTCQDSLEIRFNIPGQPGIRYCGDGLNRTIRSLKNVIMLTLRTDGHQVSSDTGFNATATLFSPATDECYDPSTKGVHYRGTMDYTRSMRLCLNWISVQHCFENTFNTSDLSHGQEQNYCRNPDNTAMPWCYTAAHGCQRDYCDVCNNERDYDRTLACIPVVCNGSRDSILDAGCAAYCHLAPPPAPVRAQTCSSPPVLSDAKIVGSSGSIYHVGETITYDCNTGPETATITCLSNGQWTPLGSVCGSCSPGWTYWSGSCYKLFSIVDGVNYQQAEHLCDSLRATVASAKDAQEADFISNLRGLEQMAMWIGADDRDWEGSFRWPDGDLLTWTNWKVAGTSGQPKNNDKDCVIMDPPFRGAKWNDMNCVTDVASLYVCEYPLSARVNCVDRADCSPLLSAEPLLCTKYPGFAHEQCARSCSICSNGSAVQCNIPVPASTQVVSPQGQQQVSMGTAVIYQCVAGTALTGGQLSLVCGDGGQFNGERPVCADPDTTIQDSSDMPLVFRPELAYPNYSYVGVGAKYRINRHGVIKCWKYYSPAKGYSFFQVWRDDPTNVNNLLLVGENQVKTQGNGVEIFCVPEADWIRVKPGDHLGLWEGTAETRGQIGYKFCVAGETFDDYNVTRSIYATYGDFSTRIPTPFNYPFCFIFSYKAVIYPDPGTAPTSVPTHQHPLLQRAFVPSPQTVILGGGSDYIVPFDGVISQIEAFAAFAGLSALQVWRPRPDKGVDSFELVGQRKLDLTSNFTAGVQVWSLSEGQRINVRQGDVLGLYSYARGGAGIQYTTLCTLTTFPEGGPSRQSVNFDADATHQYDVLSIPPTSVACQAYSYRAIVSKAPNTNRPSCNTAPANPHVALVGPAGEATVPWGADVLYECSVGYVVTQGALRLTCGEDGNLIGVKPVCEDITSHPTESSDVPLIARATTQWHSYVYLGTGNKTTINRQGTIKQWRLHSTVQGGLTVLQVWRPVPNVANSYVLVGQTPVVTTSSGVQTWVVPEQDWISVQPGDVLGIWEPNDPSVAIRGGVRYDTCSSTDFTVMKTTASNSRADYSLTTPTKFTVDTCRVFSYRAVIFPVATPTVRATNQALLIARASKGWGNYLHFGDSVSYKIPVDGKIKQWQFYTNSAGEAALQVWRKISGDSFLFVGQTIITLGSTAPRGLYNWTLPAGQEIPVKAGDYTGLWYGSTLLGITIQTCDVLTYPEGAQQRRTLSTFTASTLTAGTSTMSVPLKTTFTCYSASFRAIVTP